MQRNKSAKKKPAQEERSPKLGERRLSGTQEIKAKARASKPASTHPSITVGPLSMGEAMEADRIMRVAFGTFLGVPDPEKFMGDRQFMVPRVRSKHVVALAARENGRLIGSNLVTLWGSFAFFGPLTVLPEYWDRGVGQRLLEATLKVMDKCGVRHSGLFTFAQSAKHVGLYQKFGYWPQHLTAILTRTPEPGSKDPRLLSQLKKAEREATIAACAQLTHRISSGLDLTHEIRAVLAAKTGEVVLAERRGLLEGFAVCMSGPGSEGGEKVCYVKFGAVRGGPQAAERFDRLLDGCESVAAARGAIVEAGVNLARGEAFRHLRSRGYKVTTQGVAMERPHGEGFNRPRSWVIDDWR
jgi:GNAT superfamily N-acetyltransferase